MIELLKALWAINRHAKRKRDAARRERKDRNFELAEKYSKQKEHFYCLKAQVIAHLLLDHTLKIIGYHRFSGEFFSEVIVGNGYCFHRPCAAPENCAEIPMISDIEAKPKRSRDPRLCDAEFTLTEFLKDKPMIPVYSWPEREKVERVKRSCNRFEQDDFEIDEFEDTYFED